MCKAVTGLATFSAHIVSHSGNKEIRHFVTTNYDQKYPFAFG